MARKVIKLQLENDYDFLLLGLVSTTKDYRLGYHINKTLEIDLIKQEDIELLVNKKGNTDSFSFLSFVNDDEEEYFLIGNKGKTTSLIQEYKALDYFFMVKNQLPSTNTEELTQKLNALPLVLGVYGLNASELKSRDNLLF